MAPFLFWMMVFVQVFPDYQVTRLARYFLVNNCFQSIFLCLQNVGERVFFDLGLLNTLFLPLLGLCLGLSVLLARPYHRYLTYCLIKTIIRTYFLCILKKLVNLFQMRVLRRRGPQREFRGLMQQGGGSRRIPEPWTQQPSCKLYKSHTKKYHNIFAQLYELVKCLRFPSTVGAGKSELWIMN